MLFFVSLITALGAAFIYDKIERFSAEVAILCVAIALASVVLTLVAAPWPIQLVLATLLMGSRFLRTGMLDM